MDASTQDSQYAMPQKPLLWLTHLGTLGFLSLMGAQPVLAQTILEVTSSEATVSAATAPQIIDSAKVKATAPPRPTAAISPEPAAIAPLVTTSEPAPVEIALPEPSEPAPAAIAPLIPAGIPNDITPASVPDDITPAVIPSDEAVPVMTHEGETTEILPVAPPTVERVPIDYSNVLIDPTDYSIGATENPNIPSIVIAERSTGCHFMLEQGQALPENVCDQLSEAQQIAMSGADQPQFSSNSAAPSFKLGPVSISTSGVRISGVTSAASREYFNRLVRPLVNLQSEEAFLFPLSIPAPFTSLFGWRNHPIFNARHFHTGTDLGAPLGTPVLATQAGRVAVADFLGGYGLTVVLHHDEKATGTLESRYAHLSQLMVQPGEWVEKGDVVGLVGSTGNSTGPHLHFELRQLTADGWVALNPDQVLQTALTNLVNTLNNPMLALNPMAAIPTTTAPEATAPEGQSIAFRPAQPNAN